MRKLLSLVLALCLALSCAAFTAAAETAELDPAKLTVWLGGVGKQKDSDAVWDHFNEQLKNYLPNTTVEFYAVNLDEYSEKWSKAMAAGETIDVAWFGWIQNINNEVSMGSLMPLKALIEEYGQDMAASIGEAALAAHTINGEIYAIPCWQGLAGSSRCDIQLKGDVLDAMENKNYVAELEAVIDELQKVDDLTTRYGMFYDKYEEYLASAKETGTLALGYFDFGLLTFMHDRSDFAAGTYVNAGDDTFTLHSPYITDSDAFKLEAYKYSRLQDYWQKGFFREDYRTCDMDLNFGGGDPKNSWVGDISTSGLMQTKDMMGEEAANARASGAVGFDVKLVSGNTSPVMQKGYSTATVIPYTADDPERAMMYINLLNSTLGKDLYTTLAYGIEGTHYDMNEDGTMNLFGAVNGNTQPDSTWTYGQWDWATGTMLNSSILVGEDPDTYFNLQEIEKTAVVLPLYDFNFDPTNVEMELANYEAISEEYKYLYTYEDYEDRMRARNDKLMAAGYDLIFAEIESQMKAYIEANNITAWPEY